jgi:RNA polymerase sigma-B factor
MPESPAQSDPPANGGIPPERRRAEERRLLDRFTETRDERIREELVQRFLPLARSLALRYRGGSETVEDLTQVASLGLLKAIDRFDPKRQADFVAYAAPTILGELRHHFRDRSWSVRLPRGLQERSMQVAEAIREIGSEEQHTASVAEVAERCDLEESEVVETLQADRARRTTSLDLPTTRGEDDSPPMVETLASEELGFERAESELASRDAQLRPKEREALHLRFHEGLTQREIGARIGVSQMQVSRLLRSALGKLLVAVRGGEEVAAGSNGGGSEERQAA